jgi:hypothetical protein
MPKTRSHLLRRSVSVLFALLVVGAVAGLAVPAAVVFVVRDGKVVPALVLNPPQAFSPADPDCPAPAATKMVLANASVYLNPDPNSSVLGQIRMGELVCAEAPQGSFARIRETASGVQGWIDVRAIPTVFILNVDGVLAEPGNAEAAGRGDPVVAALGATTTPGEVAPRSPAQATATPAPAATPTATPAPAATPTATPTPASGGVSGTAGITVSQALRIKLAMVTGGATGLGLVSDNGTAFTVAAEVATGGSYIIELVLRNLSNSALNGRLELTIPEGLNVSVSAADGVLAVGQAGPGVWIFQLAANHDNMLTDLKIKVSVGVDPGSQTITGRLRQVAS